MSSSQRASISPGRTTAAQRDTGTQIPPFQPDLTSLPPSVPRSQQPSMIGPPPSFYDPNQAIVPEGTDYRQWVMENYGTGGQQQGQQPQQQFYGHTGMAGNVPFQSQLPHASPTNNQYTFVTPDFPSEPFEPHHRPQRGLPRGRQSGEGVYSHGHIPNNGAGPFSHPQPSPSGQYPLPSPSSSEYYLDNPTRPGHEQQYNFVPGFNSTDQFPPGSQFTPNSDLTPLSSVSTPSVGGTDDSPARAYPMASQHSVPVQQRPPPSGSRRAPAAGARKNTGRSKRPRRQQEVSQDEDSDTQSDDDLGYTTVNVPPSQGQSSLPARL
ncbi:uncharacterized protein BXZ73DRAFT_106613 [Epithele typhae]|uniref:uncharacterized protein n=1 Tax=Epithele typhae TaxID=378194 RepID=UPI0020087638|nr:uncharacterized protein BXZ73DRAFT_106613 [Epithele typhae]KAH9914370.1 hypothetical protein BXZ73DRAFT_106613 [Epithele typhae]